MTVEYVLLYYCATGLSASGRIIAVVFRAFGSNQICIRRIPNWEQGMTEDDLDYMQGVFADLEDMPGRSEIPDLEMFCQWSAGAFRSKGVETCEEQELDSLLATPMISVK